MRAPNQALQSIVKLATGVLCLVACFFLAKAIMIWMNPQSVWTALPANAQPNIGAAPGGSGPALDYSFDPFFRDLKVDDVIEPTEDPGEDAEETTLNIKLTGTDAPVSAIIEGSDRQQLRYALKDEVTGGVTLDSVHAGYVILLRDGNREKLSLERVESGLNGQPTTKGTRISSPIPNNPAALLSRVSITPHRSNNRLIGYKIQGRPGFDIKPLGFRDGDIITRVGKTDLTQPGIDLNSTIIGAMAAGNPTAQIMRRGRKMTIRIRIP